MSSKSSHYRHRRYDSEDSDDGERKRHHHHRHRHGHRDRHRSHSRSRSPSPSPKHRKAGRENRDLEKHSHSREHKPPKHRDREHEDKKKQDRHHKQRLEEETRENYERREKKIKGRNHDDRDAERHQDERNGDENHRVPEKKQEVGVLRGKWENDPGAEDDSPRDRDRGPRNRGNSQGQGQGQQSSQIRIKQERELNDERRTQDAKRKPQNPFMTESEEAGPSREGRPLPEKEKPDFGTSGKLTEDTNTYRGIVIKYNEPSEARKPKRKWRLYVFKGDQELPMVHIHRQSAYLLGRERRIADLPIDHPSCSKQHAVLQYRLVQYERPDGNIGKKVRPYIIDLESSNGTYINNKKIEPKRYYELQEKDVLKFGYSTREYVLLHDKSKDDTADEDMGED